MPTLHDFTHVVDLFKAVVKAYQALAGRTVDGKYGPGDAKSLATTESGNHVPPTPRYWPKGTYPQALASYQTWLRTRQAQDGARAGEWAMALAKVKEHYPS